MTHNQISGWGRFIIFPTRTQHFICWVKCSRLWICAIMWLFSKNPPCRRRGTKKFKECRTRGNEYEKEQIWAIAKCASFFLSLGWIYSVSANPLNFKKPHKYNFYRTNELLFQATWFYPLKKKRNRNYIGIFIPYMPN